MRAVRSLGLAIAFDPVIFFSDSLVMEDGGVSPEEVFKMERAGGYLAAFIQSVNKASVGSRVENVPTLVLKML
jgi:hypothetical protein